MSKSENNFNLNFKFKTINDWTLLKWLGTDRHCQSLALAMCKCGRVKKVRVPHVKSEHTKRCKECDSHRRKTHGLRKVPLYRVWQSMKQRCLNPEHHAYSRYGGRGIKICGEWMNDFESFYDWSQMANYREGLELDRVNNNGNYEPNNCRFTTKQVNTSNRETTRFCYVKMSFTEASRQIGKSRVYVSQLFANGKTHPEISFILPTKPENHETQINILGCYDDYSYHQLFSGIG